jgi:hypothetical protein
MILINDLHWDVRGRGIKEVTKLIYMFEFTIEQGVETCKEKHDFWNRAKVLDSKFMCFSQTV